MKENRRMWTCNRMDLQTIGSLSTGYAKKSFQSLCCIQIKSSAPKFFLRHKRRPHSRSLRCGDFLSFFLQQRRHRCTFPMYSRNVGSYGELWGKAIRRNRIRSSSCQDTQTDERSARGTWSNWKLKAKECRFHEEGSVCDFWWCLVEGITIGKKHSEPWRTQSSNLVVSIETS